jgi:hypothetical protein
MRNAFLFSVTVILGLEMTSIPGSDTTAWGQTPGPKSIATAVPKGELADFQSRLLAATTKHLDLLINPETKVAALKGKSADGMTALAFYRMYELTGDQKYRTAAVALADRIVKDMKATKHGVLYIKEKDSGGGESIAGGGPPALGWYASSAAYIYHKEGGKLEDIAYIATVIDNFPWNENGWWANTIDIKTGRPKEPLTKPGAINKNAVMAMCAGMVSGHVKAADSELSSRLKGKADKCLYAQIIPAQEADGYWHYGLKGTDPKGKDVLGYFMLTTQALIGLQRSTDGYRDRTFQSALDRACAFALKHIAPMTDPNQGPVPPADRRTAGTPTHYTLADEPKRGFDLGILLFAARSDAEGAKIIDCALSHFPFGDAGMDGAHAVHPSALILSLLRREASIPKSKGE